MSRFRFHFDDDNYRDGYDDDHDDDHFKIRFNKKLDHRGFDRKGSNRGKGKGHDDFDDFLEDFFNNEHDVFLKHKDIFVALPVDVGDGVIIQIDTSETGDYEISINTGEETVVQTVLQMESFCEAVNQTLDELPQSLLPPTDAEPA